MSVEEWRERIAAAGYSIDDPALLAQLPSGLVARLRPDLFWTCLNCMDNNATPEYKRMRNGPHEAQGDGAAAAEGAAAPAAAAALEGAPPVERCGECQLPRTLVDPAVAGVGSDLAALVAIDPPDCPGFARPHSRCSPLLASAAPSARPGRTALIYDARMTRHVEQAREAAGAHPERPDRVRAIWQHLAARGLVARCLQLEARRATAEELRLVHSEAHVAAVEAHCRDGAMFTSDTYACPDSWEAALLSAGSVCEMAIQVARGDVRNGFCVGRPPGHHAEPGLAAGVAVPGASGCPDGCGAMGFCLFNNCAVAARAAQRAVPGCEKVLIVDWDVHHGNGSQTAFYDDPSVLYFSAHRFEGGRFYPAGPAGGPDRVGEGAGEGYNMNVGWPCGGVGDLEYVAAFCRCLLPVAHAFAPDLVIVSAGFDAADGDPLGGCAITPPGYGHLTALLAPLAGGRLVVALEGGYNLRSIARSAEACVGVLLGEQPLPLPRTDRGEDEVRQALTAVDESIGCLAAHWPVLGAMTYAKPEAPRRSFMDMLPGWGGRGGGSDSDSDGGICDNSGSDDRGGGGGQGEGDAERRAEETIQPWAAGAAEEQGGSGGEGKGAVAERAGGDGLVGQLEAEQAEQAEEAEEAEEVASAREGDREAKRDIPGSEEAAAVPGANDAGGASGGPEGDDIEAVTKRQRL
jgi:acetoin utilization deacetylase AcuC-like enzyme